MVSLHQHVGSLERRRDAFTGTKSELTIREMSLTHT